MLEPTERKEMIREYKRTQKDMGVLGLRNISGRSLTLLPSTDVQGLINKCDFAKKTNCITALPNDFRKVVEQHGFDSFVIEVVQLIDPKPEATTQERMEELEALYEILMDEHNK